MAGAAVLGGFSFSACGPWGVHHGDPNSHPGTRDAAPDVQSDAGADAPSDTGSPPETDAGDEAAQSLPFGPYTGDCTTARWMAVSDACWSCFCNRCRTETNNCNGDCANGVYCAAGKHVLVGEASQLSCELRGFAQVCLTDPTFQAGVGPLLQFDTCLIAQHQPPEQLRACEQECGMTYTGDVCERFPAPDGG